MRLLIFSIHDGAANAYINPFFVPNIGLAKRTFQSCANDHDHMFGKFPQDFTLFELGSWEADTCKFDIFNSPVSHGKAIEYVLPEDHPINQGRASIGAIHPRTNVPEDPPLPFPEDQDTSKASG